MNKVKIVFRHTPLNWKNKHIGLGSYLIRKITKSEFDHIELLIEIDGVQYVESGTAKGVRRMLFSDWKNLYKGQSYSIKQIYSFRTQEEMDFLYEIFQGVKYDYESLFWHLIYRLTERLIGSGKWYGKGTRNAFGAFYCSEWLAFKLGIPQWFKRDVKYFEDIIKIK